MKQQMTEPKEPSKTNAPSPYYNLNAECPRCGKKNVDIHTCNPTKSYRAAIVEGLEIAREYFRCIPAKNSKQTMYDGLSEMIKNYQEPK